MKEFLSSDHLITKGEVAALYKEEIEKSDEDNPALMKWAIAVDFCNDLSFKMGLEPCYYYNGKPVDRRKDNANYPTGEGYECRFKNNGWRLPTLLEHINDLKTSDKWEWTTDIGGYNYYEARIIVRDNKGETGSVIDVNHADPELKLPFKICRFK